MEHQLVLIVLASVVLFGGALVALMRTDRRREERQQRLKSVTVPTAPGPIADEPVISLRRPLRHRAVLGMMSLPAHLLARLDASLAATGNWIGIPHLIITAVVATLVAVLFATRIMAFGPVLVVVFGGAAAVGAPLLLLRLAQVRYQRRFLNVFPEAIDLIVRAVRAGLPVVEAMEVAAREVRPPVGAQLQRTLEEVRVGVDIGVALQQTADRIRVPEFRFYVVALELQRRTGGGLAETLGNLSSILRRRRDVYLKTRALSAEAKASAAILTILPFVVGALLSVFNPDLMSVLLRDPRGRFMLGLAFLSLVTGLGTMAMIIRRALRY